MESWKAWTILIIIILIAAGVGFFISQYTTGNANIAPEIKQEIPVEEKIEQPKAASAPRVIQAPQEEQTTSTPQENTDVKKIIDLYDSSVNGFLYFFEKDKYFVKNNKIKIELDYLRETADGKYNVVYLDTRTKEAVAFCQDKDDVSGRKCDGLKNKPVQVMYNQFYVFTPADWMDKMRTAQDPTVTFKAKTLFNRRVDEITWEQGSAQTTVYVDHTFGVPIEAIQGTEKWDYLQMGINQVAALDVTRPDIR